ncbi:MAG TPA: hypothetical protein VLK84_25790 [Longimicrobium sp.]|nr:hypothetical protein [Longimicrobium sp.]
MKRFSSRVIRARDPAMTRRRRRLRGTSWLAAAFAFVLGACGKPDVVFESHLMHDHGDEHGMPSMSHSADIQPGQGEIRVSGKVPVGLCPAVRGEVELEERQLSLHVDTRRPEERKGERCESPHPVAMAEYTATVAGLPAGEYRVVVHHDAMSVTQDRNDSKRRRTRYSKAEVADVMVQVR